MWWRTNWRLVLLVAGMIIVVGAVLYVNGVLMPWNRTPISLHKG